VFETYTKWKLRPNLKFCF